MVKTTFGTGTTLFKILKHTPSDYTLPEFDSWPFRLELAWMKHSSLRVWECYCSYKLLCCSYVWYLYIYVIYTYINMYQMIMFAHQARQRLGDIWGVCAISQLFFKHNIFEKGIIIIIIIRWALVMIYKYIYIYTQGIFKFMYDSYDSDPERLLGLEIPWNSKSQVIHIWSRGLQKVVWACMELRGYVCYVYAYLYNIYI